MDNCKFCGCNQLVKNGFNEGVQRYKCKDCGRNMRPGDKRVRYSHDKKLKVIKLYLEGVGIRSIERLEGVSSPLIIKWIRQTSAIIQEKLAQARAGTEKQSIQILELDELFSYCQKKSEKSTFGLLLTDAEIALLTLK